MKKSSTMINKGYKLANLSQLQSNAKQPPANKYDKYNAETNVQIIKQRLDKIKSVMDESDFQLQTKTKTNIKLALAYKNTADEDAAEEEESEEDEFTQQLNKMLKPEDDSAQKKNNSNPRSRESSARNGPISDTRRSSMRSFRFDFQNKEENQKKKEPEINI